MAAYRAPNLGDELRYRGEKNAEDPNRIDARTYDELTVQERTGYGEESELEFTWFRSLAQRALEDVRMGEPGFRIAAKAVFEFFATFVFTFAVLFGGWYIMTQSDGDGTITDEEVDGTASYLGFHAGGIGGTVTTGGSLTALYLGGQIGSIFLSDSPDFDPLSFTLQSVTAFTHAVLAGLAFAVAITIFGYFSAEINPWYSFFNMFLPRRNISMGMGIVEGIAKIIGQFAGAFAAIGLVAWILAGTAMLPPLFVPTIARGYAFLLEIVCTFILFWVMYTVQYNPAPTGSITPGITLGFLMTALTLIAYPLSGAVFNVAIYIAHGALVGGFPSYWWVYVFGSGIGAALGLVFYLLINRIPAVVRYTPGS